MVYFLFATCCFTSAVLELLLLVLILLFFCDYSEGLVIKLLLD